MKKLIILPLLLFPTVTLAMPTEKHINTCRSVSDNNLRLSCYDVLFSHNAKKVPKSNQKTGDWHIDSEVSPIDDSTNVHIVLFANEEISLGKDQKERPAITIRCQENETEFYISWQTKLSDTDDFPEVVTRVDKNLANRKRWHISTSREATFYPDNNITFIKSLLGKNRLFARTAPKGLSPVSVTFTLTGLDEVIKPLRQECGW